jgi:hypothetical protein
VGGEGDDEVVSVAVKICKSHVVILENEASMYDIFVLSFQYYLHYSPSIQFSYRLPRLKLHHPARSFLIQNPTPTLPTPLRIRLHLFSPIVHPAPLYHNIGFAVAAFVRYPVLCDGDWGDVVSDGVIVCGGLGFGV